VSAEQLQKLAVRMHHDPALVTQVYEQPEDTALREGISVQLLALLSAPDRRAWGADTQRRDRVVEALRVEYPVSCALVELAGLGRAVLLDFFSTTHFHACVGRWGVQALAFADFLDDLSAKAGPALSECLALERALAQVRRSPLRPRQISKEQTLPLQLLQAPWLQLVSVRSGTLALHGGIRDWLAGGEPPMQRELGAQDPELLIVERRDEQGGLSVGELPAALFEVVQRAEGQASSAELKSVLQRHGAEVDEAAEVLNSLLSDQVLIRAVMR